MAIQKETNLTVADNTGAKEIRVIQVVGSTGKDSAHLGELVRCSVKKALPGGSVKKKDVVTAVIVRTRKEYRRADGSYIRFGDNAAVIVKDKEPIGSRVFGPIAREIRANYPSIVSKAPEVV